MNDDITLDLFAGPGGSPGECWTNIGRENGNGYRKVTVNGKREYVHRLSYACFNGPIPDGLPVDHKCHNEDHSCRGGKTCPHRACWNPAHLQVVPEVVNIMLGQSPPARNARKVTCPNGHPYAIEADGTRRCSQCRYERRVQAGETSGRGRPETRARCPRGHPYGEANTYLVYRADGSLKQRACREYGRQRVRARRKNGGR